MARHHLDSKGKPAWIPDASLPVMLNLHEQAEQFATSGDTIRLPDNTLLLRP
jgi:hypothetical protein